MNKVLKPHEKIDELKKKFEQNSLEAKNDEIKSKQIKETYNNKIMKLKDEIETLNIKIKNNKEAGIKYYLILLKEGNDNRNVGLPYILYSPLLNICYKNKHF